MSDKDPMYDISLSIYFVKFHQRVAFTFSPEDIDGYLLAFNAVNDTKLVVTFCVYSLVKSLFYT